MRHIGFSTGAIALDDFEQALEFLEGHSTQAVELSALRVKELRPLISALPHLRLAEYSYISIHLPSTFSASEEVQLLELLDLVPRQYILIVHPDSIHNHALWRPLGARIALENMDRRKTTGRTAVELRCCFDLLPEARLCFDVGHARQFDPSMAEAYMILSSFADRLAQVHISEVDAQSRHAVITYAAELAFREIAHLVPADTPLILESRVAPNEIQGELDKVAEMFCQLV